MPPSSYLFTGFTNHGLSKIATCNMLHFAVFCWSGKCLQQARESQRVVRETHLPSSPLRGVLQSLSFNSRVGFPSQQSISLLLLRSSMKWFWGLDDWKKTSFENQRTVSVARSAVSTKQAPGVTRKSFSSLTRSKMVKHNKYVEFWRLQFLTIHCF